MNKTNSLDLNAVVKMVAVIAVLGCIVLCVAYYNLKNTNNELASQISITKEQDKIIDFGDQFVKNVLMNDQEIDFDTRLKLENDVRAIGDDEITSQWEQFTDSETESEAQEQVKNLLGLFFEKLK